MADFADLSAAPVNLVPAASAVVAGPATTAAQISDSLQPLMALSTSTSAPTSDTKPKAAATGIKRKANAQPNRSKKSANSPMTIVSALGSAAPATTTVAVQPVKVGATAKEILTVKARLMKNLVTAIKKTAHSSMKMKPFSEVNGIKHHDSSGTLTTSCRGDGR